MTDPTVTPEVVAAAYDDAARAARDAGVEVRTLDTIAGFRAAAALYGTVWGRPDLPPMNVETMRALQKSGNYVAGVFAGGELVGAAAGFFEPPAVRALHSHIGAVIGGTAGRGAGRALKLHQRAWALDNGLLSVVWTFDPLIRRNAYFNLVKLAARPTEYLPDFYGTMPDAINAGDESDRLLIEWNLLAPLVGAAARGDFRPGSASDEHASGAVVALEGGMDGRPRVPAHAAGSVHLVAVPADIEGMRGSDPSGARAWRQALREALAPLLDAGGRVTGFDREGWYIVTTGGDAQ